MKRKTLTAVATGLLCLACGCVAGDKHAPRNRQQMRARRQQVAAVAALLKAQGHGEEAARLQQQCQPESQTAKLRAAELRAADAAEWAPDEAPDTTPDTAPAGGVGEQESPSLVPPIPRPTPPPEPVDPAPFPPKSPAADEQV